MSSRAGNETGYWSLLCEDETLKITTIENPSVQESQPIEAGLRDYGLAQVNGIVPQKWAFHANLRGELIGGATGRVHFSQFYLDNLWVREEFRAKGVGENIHRHVVACAKNCGCRRIQLNTLNPRAVTFYLRLGYRTLAVIENYVDGFNLSYMAKGI